MVSRRSTARTPAGIVGAVRIDLHTHSIASDGTETPADVARAVGFVVAGPASVRVDELVISPSATP